MSAASILLVAYCFSFPAMVRYFWHAHLLKVLFFGSLWPTYASIPHPSCASVVWNKCENVLQLNRLVEYIGIFKFKSLTRAREQSS